MGHSALAVGHRLSIASINHRLAIDGQKLLADELGDGV